MEVLGRKIIVISAINFFEGGPLSLLKDCLNFLNSSGLSKQYKIVCLVHDKSLFNIQSVSNIELVEFSRSRISYFHRIYYEFIYFKFLSKKLNPILWFSLHDISPNVGRTPQAVYCHNPSPFNSINLKDLVVQPKQFLFRLFYRFLYQINIHKNVKVVVQQHWIAHKFSEMYALGKEKLIVSIPEISLKLSLSGKANFSDTKCEKVFILPAYPRPFKNIALICKTINILNDRNIDNFRVLITLDGSENLYSKSIVDRFDGTRNLHFIGIKSREEIFELYSTVDCLLFPSKLETWGLPLSEFMSFNKPIFVSDLPYAIETLNGYDKAYLFNPDDEYLLADALELFIKGSGEFKFSIVDIISKDFEVVSSWEDLFKKVIDLSNV